MQNSKEIVSKIHLFGASGAGSTTLGRYIAKKLSLPYLDTDDFYWKTTDPPFEIRTDKEARLKCMHEVLAKTPCWVLSGTLDGWGDELIQHFDLVVFLRLDNDVRMHRLKQREFDRYGKAVEPLGHLFDKSKKFLDWANEYESGVLPGRSLSRHEKWLSSLSCPTLTINSNLTTDDMFREITKRYSIEC